MRWIDIMIGVPIAIILWACALYLCGNLALSFWRNLNDKG